MVQLQSLLKLLNLTPVFPVYQVVLSHPGNPEHAQFFANQRRLANPYPNRISFFPVCPLLPCTSVWQPVPTVATSRCGLSNSSANAFAEAPGPAVAAQELSALSGLMGRKKSQAALQNRSHFTGAFEAGEKQGWVVADARFSVRRQRDPH